MYEPVAIKTRLGWIVYGGSDKLRQQFLGYHSLHHCECKGQANDELHDAVKEFFALEKAGIEKPTRLIESNDDRRARTILESLQRTDSGRYKMRLLWKFDKFRLPENKAYALRRAQCLETKLKKQPQLATVLSEKMKDYVHKGYVRKLTDKELAEEQQRVWYLPIFPVFNANKPNKVRLVWDAAAKVHGISLNSMLLKGPDQNCSLNDVLIRFRENRIAVCGDIREMFHQVLISEEDQHCQRFLWKDNLNDDEPSTYVMQVMTFGASCSPSSAQYVKNFNAEQYKGQYPRAAAAITECHYVDDMLLSVESEREAIKLAQEVRFIHSQAGFEMRNWLSNSQAVVAALNECSGNEKSLNVGEQMSTEKVLGMWWCTLTDSFTYKLSPKHEEDLLAGRRVPTKREVLRTLMAIFDPLGFLSNLLIALKIILQQIWRSSIGWDDRISMKLFDDWLQWLSVLPTVKDIKIPRCYLSNLSLDPETSISLHTFVDASELAYAAVTYVRFQQGDRVECVIVGAKARVAPLKFLSTPRMELQAAVIGVRLADSISKALLFKINQRIFWSDSRDVLCWIRSDHRRYSHYVGHRVSEILDTTQIGDWKWVPTDENVADEATKWQRLPDLKSGCRWLSGPEFLREDEAAWPVERFGKSCTEEELRPNASCNVHSLLPAPFIELDRFRSWNFLRRTAAWILRFAHNAQYKKYQERWCGPLSGKELRQGEMLMFRQAQSDFFKDEINSLLLTESTTPTVHKSSPIYKLWPFLDEEQVLRATTRIEACEAASMDAKNPIILPKDHPISRLIVLHYHIKYYHRNHQTVINELRQRFRVTPRLSSLYWKVRANCQLCKNLKAAPRPPRMGNLPSTRLSTFTRPFSFIGIDYFGPMFVSVKRSTEKRWGVLITCLTVRAIHIEIAHSLSSESCIMALRNFMGRRGTPIQIFSDRGTNFIGANKELKLALGEMDQNIILQEISSPNTTWSFIPPASPHMGGSWERMIQTVKRNLNQIKPKHQLNDEVLRNLLIEVENIVNSRPLTHVSSEDPEQPVLTPNHFLVGSSNGLKPASSMDNSEQAVRRTWRSSQVEANIFWKRWVRDYLPDLTQRSKWHSPVVPIKVDDIVVIVDANLPRNCWPMGRVISAEASSDGEVRKAVVQTANGVYERPAVKLAVLDVRR
ncbi:uncharacterized protein LOC129752959 [Uranotaenia lowii]|uniref:uncharacterized protein LOC129752959 n=1 Tax=Uranotaenia lowii TaxID=190385 RepID=UPI0024796DB7|nr:uncharacterized protein LOC129752959 [Uranotaenia lowii]